MSKLSLLIFLFLLLNNCSINKKQEFWNKEKVNIEEIENTKTILTKKVREEKEFNPTLKIRLSPG